jgi:hypothetical protein
MPWIDLGIHEHIGSRDRRIYQGRWRTHDGRHQALGYVVFQGILGHRLSCPELLSCTSVAKRSERVNVFETLGPEIKLQLLAISPRGSIPPATYWQVSVHPASAY